MICAAHVATRSMTLIRNRRNIRPVSVAQSAVDVSNDQQKARYAARQKQMTLAKERGETHIGHDYDDPKKVRRRQMAEPTLPTLYSFSSLSLCDAGCALR